MAALQPLTAITTATKEECRVEASTKCTTIVTKQLLEDKIEKTEECEMREVAKLEKVENRRVQLRQSRPSHEVESFCSMTAVRLQQRHRAGAATRRSANWIFEAFPTVPTLSLTKRLRPSSLLARSFPAPRRGLSSFPTIPSHLP